LNYTRSATSSLAAVTAKAAADSGTA